ncbi:uncharacterized protein BT62DRAFT_189477 [Guyanagaster necrorhizus]|uniref:Uncharacterized protein n=1 Tax=Guyanagaster necrorhizus TaxID=856835 RepID=A0A9P8ARE2_9AGAR|nr:uncharacterized protein BT62DRAFT_189477 [Guyanagaster necrorhizus MCA 3950]KAG7445308.1 hypothetical protein BT62DRAFT_189477 [Guyanagaster necrorhizus MCA 3950]
MYRLLAGISTLAPSHLPKKPSSGRVIRPYSLAVARVPHPCVGCLVFQDSLRALYGISYTCSRPRVALRALFPAVPPAHVKELWQDMIALGIYRTNLWDAVDLAWRIVIGALTIAARNAN